MFRSERKSVVSTSLTSGGDHDKLTGNGAAGAPVGLCVPGVWELCRMGSGGMRGCGGGSESSDRTAS